MNIKDRFNKLSKRQREWAWFVGLWLAGMLTISTIAYGIRWVIRTFG